MNDAELLELVSAIPGLTPEVAALVFSVVRHVESETRNRYRAFNNRRTLMAALDFEPQVRLIDIEPEPIYIDSLVQECGFFTSDTDENNGYGCTCPAALWPEKQYPGCCYTSDCPLGREMDEEADGFDADSMSPGYWILRVRKRAEA